MGRAENVQNRGEEQAEIKRGSKMDPKRCIIVDIQKYMAW